MIDCKRVTVHTAPSPMAELQFTCSFMTFSICNTNNFSELKGFRYKMEMCLLKISETFIDPQ
ncbi:hypothetical protein PUN28_003323 [Cardiocondyla obscurior]|uniref:Uncharacterized protein n=1 Tax=Cardiocondyla obscurior TaxID=286306 RepID=A0AAW2GLF3_9HYME